MRGRGRHVNGRLKLNVGAWQARVACAIVSPLCPEVADVIRRILLVLFLGSLAMACGGAQAVVEESALPAERKPKGLILLPVTLSTPETTALEVIARTLQAADYFLTRTELPILGPFDYGLLKGVDETQVVASDTDLLSRGEDLGDWRSWMAVHVLVTENRASNVRDIVDTRVRDPKKPNTYRQHGFESTVRVEAALLDPMRGGRLAHVVVQVQDDPTDVEPGGDPRPGITAAIRQALDRLMETSGPSLRGIGQRRTRGEGLVDSVPAMLAWHSPEMPSWNEKNREQADVVREAAALGVWDRFAPGLSGREVHNASASRGVLVRATQPPLEAGDVVLSVGGKAVSARHQFDRMLQQCSEKGCALDVWRAGQRVAVQLRWPPLRPVPVE